MEEEHCVQTVKETEIDDYRHEIEDADWEEISTMDEIIRTDPRLQRLSGLSDPYQVKDEFCCLRPSMPGEHGTDVNDVGTLLGDLFPPCDQLTTHRRFRNIAAKERYLLMEYTRTRLEEIARLNKTILSLEYPPTHNLEQYSAIKRRRDALVDNLMTLLADNNIINHIPQAMTPNNQPQPVINIYGGTQNNVGSHIDTQHNNFAGSDMRQQTANNKVFAGQTVPFADDAAKALWHKAAMAGWVDENMMPTDRLATKASRAVFANVMANKLRMPNPIYPPFEELWGEKCLGLSYSSANQRTINQRLADEIRKTLI